jgi:hypothetical protein
VNLEVHRGEKVSRLGSAFYGGQGMSAEFLSRIMSFGLYLRLSAPHEESAKFAHELSTLSPELRLRDVPGKSVERTWWMWRIGVLSSAPREQPTRHRVVRIDRSPRDLLLRLPLRLALDPRTSALPITDTRIRTKPLPAEAAGSR